MNERYAIVKKLLKLLIGIALIYAFLYWNNHWLVVTEHVYKSEKVPAAFDGLRIAQISDLHDAVFGEGNATLIEKVREADPDLIFITGDVIDSNRYNLEQSLEVVRGLLEITDVYYVLGNHEVATNKMNEIYASLSALGVQVMPNTSTIIEQDGERLAIAGIEDPLMNRKTSEMLDIALEGVPEDMLTLLLAHRPEVFHEYVQYDMDLVFSGHAHGGQFRIPGVGGLVAPGQGMFPKYTAGVYKEENTQMVVSRGLGNSGMPFRLLNFPEVIVVELQSV